MESKNAVFYTIRRIIFHQNMHNHQKSQIESRRVELATYIHPHTSQTYDFGSLIVRVIDDRHYRKTHELFSALSKLGKKFPDFSCKFLVYGHYFCGDEIINYDPADIPDSPVYFCEMSGLL